MRHNLTMGLDLSTMVWRPLVRLPVSTARQLQSVDFSAAQLIARVTAAALDIEKKALRAGQTVDPDFSPKGKNVPSCFCLPQIQPLFLPPLESLTCYLLSFCHCKLLGR